MAMPGAISSFLVVLFFFLLVALLYYILNPLGLGPEPEAVLSPEFFANPAEDLSELELLVDGQAAFKEIFSEIDSAESSICIQTYIWKDDGTGQSVAAKVKAAAERGVHAVVGKDMLGTFFELGDMVNGKPSPVFTESGLKGHENIQVNTRLFAHADHSKYYIFDERSVIFGGMNIADEFHSQWHDYMVLLRGKTWTGAFKDKVLNQARWPHAFPLVLTVNSSKETEICTAMMEMIDHASKSVVIEHAYFSDDKVIEAVKRAAARGVMVDVILPKAPNTHLYANLVTINRLLDPEAGKHPRIFLYPHMSHAKVIMTDDQIVAIGSANLTPRSMRTSKELTLFVHGVSTSPFLTKLREQLQRDMAVSEEIVKPFKLGPLEKGMAFVGKHVW